MSTASLIPVADVPALIPGGVCLATVRRWYGRGVRGRKLPVVLRGGRIWVDPAEVATFISAPMVKPQEVAR